MMNEDELRKIFQEIVSEFAQSNSLEVNKEILNSQIEIISKQVEINSNILNEIKELNNQFKKSSVDINAIVRVLNNGMNAKLDKISMDADKLSDIKHFTKSLYIDVSTKDGFLPKLATRINYLWVPMILSLFTLISILIKLFLSGTGTSLP